MKCPKCEKQHRVKLGMQCPHCKYVFSFNPKLPKSSRLTDGKFQAAINFAGKKGTVAYTSNQLYAAYAGRVKADHVQYFVAAVIAGFFSYSFLGTSVYVAAPIACVAVGLIIAGIFHKPPALSRKDFFDCAKRWMVDGKKIPGLIFKPGLHTPPEEWGESDIYEYGVERILIVQRDILVDLMVRNNQHAEQRMLVISETGYPKYIVPHVARLLNERNDLTIFLLHDADAVGVGLKERIKTIPWLPLKLHPVIDMGLFPDDFTKLKQTRNYENRQRERTLPADALLLGAMVTGMSACFASHSTFAEELMREAENRISSSSDFG